MGEINFTDIVSDSSPTVPPWLIEGLMCRAQMICLAGETGVGKSVLAYNLAVCVAGGLPFLGHATLSGPVIYFDEENSLPDMKEYIRWAWFGLGPPSQDILKVVDASLKIMHFALPSGKLRWNFMGSLAHKFKPILIILDTATPVCDIIDENSNAEASQVIHRLRSIRNAGGPDTTMLVLKHAKFTHEGGRRMVRGAKTWVAEFDAMIFHVAVPGRPRKDGLRNTRLEPDKVRAFGLRSNQEIIPRFYNGGIVLENPVNKAQ